MTYERFTCESCRFWHENPREPIQIGPKEQNLVIQENIAAARATDLGKPKQGMCRRNPPQISLIATPQGLMGPLPMFPVTSGDTGACGEHQARVEV